MTAFHPPPDADRCRAIVVDAGVRGRCRGWRRPGKELCRACLHREETWGFPVPRVPQAKESQP